MSSMWFGAKIYGPFFGRFCLPLTVILTKRKQTTTDTEFKSVRINLFLGLDCFTKNC